MTVSGALTRGRAAFEHEAWADAYSQLAAADRHSPLEPDDLDRLGTAAYLIGEDAACVEAWSRAHAGFVDRGDQVRAARTAFWLASSLFDRPARQAQAGGWLARARRLLDECGQDCVEHAFILCTLGRQKVIGGDPAAALTIFDQALAIGTRFRDQDVIAFARHARARALLRMNRRTDGFALLDEVMVAVTSGELAPIITGVIYCSVISACHEAFDLGRAQEWTTALAGWCTSHPDMVPFRGTCLVRRSELMQLHGAWTDAIAEAQRASNWLTRGSDDHDAGPAYYQQAELYRLCGDLTRADESYRRASQAGKTPDPGLALLRLAQGQMDAADAAARRMLQETREPRPRAWVLTAAVEILLARQDVDAARAAADELVQIAHELDAPVLKAAAAHASGAVALAAGQAGPALDALRDAWKTWQEIDAPYEVARVRTLIGLAYRRLGDEDGAQLEFDTAQETFDRLGATLDSARLAALVTRAAVPTSEALTGREVEVLRLVATGKTNRAIATELAISEKTVARHLSNIFTKLDLSSRSAATAYAYEHKLI